MEFFNSAVDVLKTLVVALGAGLVCGAVNLMEGYGGDNLLPRVSMKQLMAGGGGSDWYHPDPLLSGLFG